MTPEAFSKRKVSTLVKSAPQIRKTSILKGKQMTFSEVTRDLLDRQKEYDKLNQFYLPGKLNNRYNSFEKQAKYSSMKNAVMEARIRFIENPSFHQRLLDNDSGSFLQQKNSVSMIAQIFRNQKSSLNCKQIQQKKLSNKWNLELMLIVTIPMICLLVILFEFIF